MTVDAASEGPRYVEISKELWRRIELGQYAVGSDLPAEGALQAEFDVSRFTVREALRILEQAGVIGTRKGSGSRILSNHRISKFGFSADSFGEVLRYIAPTTVRFKEQRRPLPKALTELLALVDPEEWAWFTGVRCLVNGQKIAVSHMIVRREYASSVGEETLGVGSTVFEAICRDHSITLTAIQQTVEATTISPAEARRLSCESGVPGLRVIREFRAADFPFEYTVSVHPIDRFKFVISLHPDLADL
jgi:DNA-binding GntR family transcriptional regulator